MPELFITLPKLGESVSDATITRWLKKEGDVIRRDEPFVEIATDKVDSELPCPYSGTLVKILVQEGNLAQVGGAICVLESNDSVVSHTTETTKETIPQNAPKTASTTPKNKSLVVSHTPQNIGNTSSNIHFLSPLVRKIVYKENISEVELQQISGSGKNGRITKEDIEFYIKNRAFHLENIPNEPIIEHTPKETIVPEKELPVSDGDEVVEFDRMRALIAKHMVASKKIAPHCTSFSEVDVTNIVQWRDAVKDMFFEKHHLKITYTHVFMLLVIETLKEFPMLNAWNKTNGVIKKKDINLGFATALPSGNLIVPVIKKAQDASILQLIESVNNLAEKAKSNSLASEDIQEGTFTVSNTGIFGSMMGTPIISQPQVAILALGEILKKPSVVETSNGDEIQVRKKMFLSLSYDHRIIDGALGARFLKSLKTKIENWSLDSAF